MFTADAVAHAQWGVSFYSTRRAATLYALNAEKFMVPASNQKILTTAVAAERLGWDFRFTTRLVATAPIDAEGAINGDLIVSSNGDPTINRRHPERWRAFDDWAAALKAQGLRIINGRLIGDDNAFAEPAWGVGWAWDNLQFGYGTPPSALQYNENQVEIAVGPGMLPGAPAIVTVSPPGGGLVIVNEVTTADAGGDTSVDIARIPGSAHLVVRGQVAADGRPTSMTASVDNPTRLYVQALRDAFARHGIWVGVAAVDADDVPPAKTDAAIELLVDRSPPLLDIIDVTMKWSRNIYAETLLLATAPAHAPATGAGGLSALRETLESWGIPPTMYLARDGSGLSRYDYVSADALSVLLRRVLADSKHAEPFQATLPVAGVSGTLANRMRGTRAEGRVRAKTGTLSNVRTLSGYLTTSDGDTIVFAMLANNFHVAANEIDAIMDAALNRVLQFAP